MTSSLLLQDGAGDSQRTYGEVMKWLLNVFRSWIDRPCNDIIMPHSCHTQRRTIVTSFEPCLILARLPSSSRYWYLCCVQDDKVLSTIMAILSRLPSGATTVSKVNFPPSVIKTSGDLYLQPLSTIPNFTQKWPIVSFFRRLSRYGFVQASKGMSSRLPRACFAKG